MATARDPDKLCQGYTDGAKHGRVWYHPPRPCRNYRLHGFTRCRVHLSGEELERYWFGPKERAAQVAASEPAGEGS